VRLDGSRRLVGVAPGEAIVTGRFGSSRASASLSVSGAVTDRAASLGWRVPALIGGATLRGVQGSQFATELSLEWASGIVWSDWASLAVPVSELLSFTSADAAVAPSAEGLVRGFTLNPNPNQPEFLQLLTCASTHRNKETKS